MYLGLLVFSCAGMVILDWRYTLFFWRSPVRAAVTLALGLIVFIVWDVWGIAEEIFFRGDSPLLVGLNVGHEFPVEELFFLTLLCYLTMNLYNGLARFVRARDARAESAGGDRP
nr:lycopene cyclase domain-containing protein [Lysinibacter cavernae]